MLVPYQTRSYFEGATSGYVYAKSVLLYRIGYQMPRSQSETALFILACAASWSLPPSTYHAHVHAQSTHAHAVSRASHSPHHSSLCCLFSFREQEAGDRRQEMRGRRRDAGDRRQETGSRRQRTGHRRQETGCRRQDAGGRRQEIGDRRRHFFSKRLFLFCEIVKRPPQCR